MFFDTTKFFETCELAPSTTVMMNSRRWAELTWPRNSVILTVFISPAIIQSSCPCIGLTAP